MIHIDDLFRQRMEDREASPKPGAWGNMRQLLDKEMPVVQAASNWRRVFGYFTGALLLASASVGGYSLYADQLHSNAGTAPGALAVSNTRIASGVAGDLNTPATSPGGISGNGTAAAAAAANSSNTGSAHHAGARQAVPAHNPATHQSAAGAQAPATTSVASSQGRNAGPGQSLGSAAARLSAAESGINPIQRPEVLATAGSHSVAGSQEDGTPSPLAVSAAASPARRSGAPAAPLVSPKRISPAANAAPEARYASGASASNSVQNSKARKNPEPLPLALNSGQPVKDIQQPAPALRILDTIRRIEIVTRRAYLAGSRKPVYRLDTLPAEYTIVERLVPVKPEPDALAAAREAKDSRPAPGRPSKAFQGAAASAQPLASSATSAPAVPRAAADAATDEANATANEVAAKLSGTKLNFWQSLRLDEKVDAAKQTLQSIQLYPGVIAGINATMFTPNSLGGFQLGLTSLIALNDNWSVLGELKYIHRFNTGSTLRDDYTRIDDAATSNVELNGTPHTRYTWNETKADHYFNYESIQTIELPIAFRYNNNRFFSQAGINLVSSRPINAREVTNFGPTKAATPASVPVGSTINPMPTDTRPTVLGSDFGSRFNVGYVFGAGYMFTPSVYLDCRMTQSFWNNGTTPGAKQISRDLLGRPSFQLSVGYRFGTGKQD